MDLLESHKVFFEQLCNSLGAGWRIDFRNSDRFRVSIFNPNLKHYSINFRTRDNRFVISDNIKSPLKSYRNSNHCTAAMTRKAESVARDLKNKIIFDAGIRLAEASQNLKESIVKKETEDVIKGVMNQLVSVSRHYSKICSFNHRENSKISGTVEGYVKEDRYRIELANLNQDQLIRIVAAISSLEA